MALEILGMDFIFGRMFKRREYFWIRAVGAVISCIVIIVFVCIAYFKISGRAFMYGSVENRNDSAFKFCFYLFIFILTVLSTYACYQNSFWVILSFCSGGYAAQHVGVNIASLFEHYVLPANEQLWVSYLLEAGSCIIVYTALFFLLVRGKALPDTAKGKSAKRRSVQKKALISVFVIFVCIGLSRITVDDATRGHLAYVAESVYAVVSCSLILYILSELLQNDAMQSDLEMMTEILHREKEHYELSKENIALINLKCHDLKHQIGALRQGASESQIRQLEEVAMIYGCIAKTGNDALDVILTEKSLYCEKHGIRLTCVAQGDALAFMEELDIYSLFGNALSNAIEEVSKITKRERRHITLNVYAKMGLLSVHVENYCESDPKFENGVPVTTKDKSYHGFGMKSMDYIAKKYGGCLQSSYGEKKFRLDILIPLEGK